MRRGFKYSRLDVQRDGRWVSAGATSDLKELAIARAELPAAERASSRLVDVFHGPGMVFAPPGRAFDGRPLTVVIREVGIVRKGVPW